MTKKSEKTIFGTIKEHLLQEKKGDQSAQKLLLLEQENGALKEELELLKRSLENEIEKVRNEARQKELFIVQQSKMAQMGEMLSMIAHQWRQPLAAISSTASALELKLILDDIDKDFFETSVKDISSYVQHLSLTINDFRNFFKDSKIASRTNFENILGDVLRIVRISLKDKNIALGIQNGCERDFYIYESEFKQVLLNLIQNAEEAIVHNLVYHGIIDISTYCNANEIIIEVSDNGGGVPLEIIDQIFDPYFSTKRKNSGSGLGLYMSRTIINKHCLGRLECFNKEEGACFRITLDPKILKPQEVI